MGVAPPNAASSSTDRYSATAATGRRIKIFDLGDASPSMRVRHDNAGVNLRKASPPTILSFMQRATTVSNSLRRRSLSRNRPWRFLEKVE